MNTPLVSVIIPAYNAENLIVETLDSVLNQTYPTLECIVIDDHSKDHTVNILNKYSNNIKYYKNPGKGACDARNYGFSLSKGQYIQYLDADDLLDKDKIKIQVNQLLGKSNYLAVAETYNFISDINEAKIDNADLYSTDDPVAFIKNMWGLNGNPHYIAQHAWLTPKAIIEKAGKWNNKLIKDQDGEFFCRVILNSSGIVYAPGAKCYYRKNLEGNTISTHQTEEHFKSQLESMRLKAGYLFERDNTLEAKKAVATEYKGIAILATPKFKNIQKEALYECNSLGGSNHVLVLGGSFIELLKKIFGWKFAKTVSYHLHRNKILINFISFIKND